MTQDIEQFRPGFEAWARKENLELDRIESGAYVNNETWTAWDAWVAAKFEASTEPSDLIACANCLRPKCEHNGKLCPPPYTTWWHAWDYENQAQPTYLKYAGGMQKDEAKGAAPGDALDAARYRWLRDSQNSDGPNYVSMYADDDLDEKVDEAMKGWK